MTIRKLIINIGIYTTRTPEEVLGSNEGQSNADALSLGDTPEDLNLSQLPGFQPHQPSQTQTQTQVQGTSQETSKTYRPKPMCSRYRHGDCRYGRKGEGCPFSHSKVCMKFVKHGFDKRIGCNEGRQCIAFHPIICRDSLLWKVCTNLDCMYPHIKGTRRRQPVYQQPAQETPKQWNRHHNPETQTSKQGNRHNYLEPQAPKQWNRYHHSEPQSRSDIIDNRNSEERNNTKGNEKLTFLGNQVEMLAAQQEKIQKMMVNLMNQLERPEPWGKKVPLLPLIKLISTNIRGLYPRNNKNKVPLLQEIAITDKVPLIVLTETHLHKGIQDEEIRIQHYEIFRTDRKDRSHGGIAMYIENSLAINTEILLSFSNGTCEIMSLFIKAINLVVAVVYRPPNTTQCQFEDIIKRLHNTLENLPDPNAEFLLCGDFNFPHANWESLEVAGGTAEEKEQARKLIALAENKYLTQFINKPTRGSNILDLLFSKNHEIIHKYELFQTNMSDHKTCEATLKINALMNTVPQKKCKAQTEANFLPHRHQLE